MNEVSYFCAGINHQAHYLDFKWKGKDAYPLIKESILARPEVYDEERVRNEMYLAFDYYVTESSGHNSEYCAWFRKRPDLIEQYCNHGTSWNCGLHAYILSEYLKRENNWELEIKDWLNQPKIGLERGHEYAAYIFNAVYGDNTMFEFNGNVRNFGLIDNLPDGCCVEVPVVVSKAGLRAIKVGKLPDQLAILNNISARCEELAIEGFLDTDPRKIFQAIAFDPLTSAVLSLKEIQKMVDEMFESNMEYLPYFKHLN